ncbi:Lrp/AsnC family transcriptional regulator [Microvirga terricola]|uniref:Lrp/AsnC family transcriptional regulator n=1 Tax=Microvirga terricola TaxID=2719797 RepID=A0ABX0VF38_9HYPH|nr:Lrp/AsnC family transcriptional regulator [Microvirga terricola]NIX78247.1 Lrp/AsnC family transcriptional regulator [Microvirga terricola]
MDELDQKLLALLRADARQPVSSLAATLKVSRATVRTRTERMVENGTIQGFTVTLGSSARPNNIRAVTMIEVEGQGADKVIKRLHGFPEVSRINTTNGRWDIVAEIEVATLEEFDQVLRRIREISGISSTETSILLSRRK